jgi:hypothetical protein
MSIESDLEAKLGSELIRLCQRHCSVCAAFDVNGDAQVTFVMMVIIAHILAEADQVNPEQIGEIFARMIRKRMPKEQVHS